MLFSATALFWATLLSVFYIYLLIITDNGTTENKYEILAERHKSDAHKLGSQDSGSQNSKIHNPKYQDSESYDSQGHNSQIHNTESHNSKGNKSSVPQEPQHLQNSSLISAAQTRLFKCPSKVSLQKAPKNCNPVHKTLYPESPFFPIYQPRHPGPSEQNYGFRETVIASIFLNRSIALSNFTTHKSDMASLNIAVPVGVRFDLDILCNFIEIVDPSDNVDQIVTVSKIREKPLGKESAEFLTEKLFNHHIKSSWEYLGIMNSASNGDLKTSIVKPIDPDYQNLKETGRISMIPAMVFNHFPRNNSESLSKYFENNIAPNLDNSKMVGFAHPYRLVFLKCRIDICIFGKKIHLSGQKRIRCVLFQVKTGHLGKMKTIK